MKIFLIYFVRCNLIKFVNIYYNFVFFVIKVWSFLWKVINIYILRKLVFLVGERIKDIYRSRVLGYFGGVGGIKLVLI